VEGTAVASNTASAEVPQDRVSDEVKKNVRVLVVDDDRSTIQNCTSILGDAGFDVEGQRKGAEAITRIKRGKADILLVDQRMPETDGFAVLRAAQEHSPETLSIVMTGYASAEASVEAQQAGAWDYLPKPFTATQLLVMVGRAAHRLSRLRQLSASNEEEGVLVDGEVQILGVSNVMKRVVKRALKVAPTDAAVFITGESGTGKELIAKFIHYESRRREKPFVPVNCAALPGELLESEMFGHRKGAFTGAVREKEGLLEVADKGTFFLDELCELPTNLQPKLLRVLQDGILRRVGSESRDAVVDTRFVSATNRDVEKALEEGNLRHDLYYRLKVVPIELPPLRERREDIPVLAKQFVRRYWEKHDLPGMQPPEITELAMDKLVSYRWPGNVRELENVIQQVVVLAEPDEALEPGDLDMIGGASPSVPRSNGSGSLLTGFDLERPYHEAKDDLIGKFERRYLEYVLERAGGNMSEAARIADIDRTTLYRIMEKHDLSKGELVS